MLGLLDRELLQSPTENAVGLSSQEAAARLARDGENTLGRKKRTRR